MDTSPFDNLTRALGTRRTVLSLLGGLATLAAAGTRPTRAKRHKKHKKSCKSPKQKCGGACLAVLTDNDNCGSCGNRCANGQTCKSGACKGSTPQGCQPGAGCEDNQVCNGDGRCRDGACQPKPTCQPNGATFLATSGLVCCSENFSSNAGTTGVETTCLPGELGNACLATGDCRSGACVGYQCVGCSAGEGVCDGYCVSLTSQSNCGTCGNACPRDQFCQDGSCQERYWVDMEMNVGSVDGLTVAPDGAILVARYLQHCVQEYDADAHLVYTYGVCGVAGADAAHLNQPSAVGISDNRVFIVDTNNDRIQVFNRRGNRYTTVSTSGSGRGQVSRPNDLDFDNDGSLYIADYGNSRILKFSANLLYQQSYGHEGWDEGEFILVVSVAVDRLGNVYGGAKFTAGVLKFANDGTYLEALGGGSNEPVPVTVAWACRVASNGDIFIAEHARVLQFTKRWQHVRTFSGWATDITALHLDEHDNLYIGSSDRSIVRYHLAASSPS